MTAHELLIDIFCCGGGASTGISQATGRHVDLAIDIDPVALAMHEANHPMTTHLCGDASVIAPAVAMRALRGTLRTPKIGFAWFSPPCTEYSQARSGTPRDEAVTDLAWVVTTWAEAERPRVIAVENVKGFATWGPDNDGSTFRAWWARLEQLGYVVEARVLCAADYGVPTTRKRLFVLARRDGQPIVWPEPTHGPGRAHPHVPASAIIDWALPTKSVFGRKKSLADATLRRIATGVRRFVLSTKKPFLVPVTHPNDSRVYDLEEPLRTVTAAHRGEFSLVVPSLVHSGNGERATQVPRTYDLEKPLGVVVAEGVKHRLCAALITKHYGKGVIGHEADRTLGTITSTDHHALTTASLAPADHSTEVAALLAKHAPRRDGKPAAYDGVVIDGVWHTIADIGTRMLSPRELGAAQGFPEGYAVPEDFTAEAHVRCIGNAVCPPLARAIVEANY